MKELLLTPVRFTPAVAAMLERRKLIRLLKPTPKINACRKKGGMLDMVYASSPRFGSHALACIRCCWGNLGLNSHPDNEEFIFMHPQPGQFKPIYMVFGLQKHGQLQKKARAGRLSGKDFLAVEIPYNDPRLSIFTVFKDTLHCEFVPAGRKPSPIFYVTEPSRLPMRWFDSAGVGLVVKAR